MNTRNIFCVIVLCIVLVANSWASDSISNILEQEQHAVKYNLATAYMEEGTIINDNNYDVEESTFNTKRKSPSKAFVMSLVVPGLGQFYNGSKIKPVAFLGIEIASWVLYSKWQTEGDDLTAEFIRDHDNQWHREDYEEKYLLWTYGYNDDDSITTAKEVSHHLPETNTQQYYEMTGKYDQFIWGWDDAELDGNDLDHYSSSNPPPRILGDDVNTPVSAHRDAYEVKRKEADDSYRKANRMVIVAVANHVVSAFEAFIMAKKYNNKLDESGGSIISSINMKPSLKSFNSFKDTPYLTLTYKF